MSRAPIRTALGAVVATILLLTLYPAPGELRPMLWCVWCGEGWLADLVLNVVLFLPLGALLALAGVRRRRAWLGGTVLSAAIECAQLFIPGRDPSLGDVLSNTAGTVLGFALAGWLVARLARPPAKPRPAVWSLLPAALMLLVIGAGGVLLRPSYPAGREYYGQWTPNLGYLEWYRGRVVHADLDEIPLPSARLRDTPRVRELLEAGAPLRVRALAGPPVSRLAPIFNIYDDTRNEVVVLGVDARDFVVRYRTRSRAAGLGQPELRLAGVARSLSPGDTLDITMWREPGGFCLRVNARRACGLTFTPGRTWSVLIYPERVPEWVRRLVDVGWMTGLLFLVGFATRAERTALVAAGALSCAGLAALPALVGLRDTMPLEWLGAGAGLLGGAGLWYALAGRVRRRGIPPRPR